jgi:hypothetical protein
VLRQQHRPTIYTAPDRMGPDAGAAAHASILSIVISGNTNAAAMMIGGRRGDMELRNAAESTQNAMPAWRFNGRCRPIQFNRARTWVARHSSTYLEIHMHHRMARCAFPRRG